MQLSVLSPPTSSLSALPLSALATSTGTRTGWTRAPVWARAGPALGTRRILPVRALAAPASRRIVIAVARKIAAAPWPSATFAFTAGMPAATTWPPVRPSAAFTVFAALAPAGLHALPYRFAKGLALFRRQLAVAVRIELLDELPGQPPAGVPVPLVPFPVSLGVPALPARALLLSFALVLRPGGRRHGEDEQHRHQSCQQLPHQPTPFRSNQQVLRSTSIFHRLFLYFFRRACRRPAGPVSSVPDRGPDVHRGVPAPCAVCVPSLLS